MLFVKLLLYRMIYIVYMLLITLTPLPCELYVQRDCGHTFTLFSYDIVSITVCILHCCMHTVIAVSYTHLTLPTILRV